MTEAWELFSSLTKELGIHVELSDDAKYAVKGEGTIVFQLESGGSFEAHDVLYVPRTKKKLLSASVMEDRGFAVMLKKGQVLIHPKRVSPDTAMSIGVREGNLYRLQGKPVQVFVHDSDNLVSYGIRGWATCTTGHCRF
jgi:hypothetical protein